MEDKEKQIWQDVANVMCECEDKEKFTQRYNTKCRGCNLLGVIRHIVFFLNNSDYRKLPKDSVVLSREEYEDLQVGKDFDYGYHEGCKNTEAYYENFKLPEERKETAEKILKELWAEFEKPVFWADNVAERIKELAKQFGVEIKE